MDPNYRKLQEILDEELVIYRRLLELSKGKRKLLLEKFSTDLTKIVGDEEKLVQRLVELEENRLGVLFEITGKTDGTLDQAIEKVADPNEKSDFWMLGTTLKDVLAEIKTINEGNQKLLEQALELTQYSIKLITTAPREVTYKPPGAASKARPPGPSLIDRKA